MEKLVKNGKVAVLYSPGYGAGWYSWHDIEELLFDPKVVQMVEARQTEFEKKQDMELYLDRTEEIQAYCTKTYGDEYYGGADSLQITWIKENTCFRVDEYDGSEGLVFQDTVEWITA